MVVVVVLSMPNTACQSKHAKHGMPNTACKAQDAEDMRLNCHTLLTRTLAAPH